MADHDHIPRPPAMASPPSADTLAPDAGSRGAVRNAHDAPEPAGDASADAAADTAAEPTRERIPGRDFAGAGEFAADQRRQRTERGAGLGAGGAANREARHPATGDGDVPVDDMD